MYKAFYNLKRNPFEITPDPSFLFPTGRHNEALAALYYGVRRRKGFVVLTGEVGTGKTLLLRCLLQSLKQSKDVAYAYIFNGRLSPIEFLQYIVSDLGLPGTSKNKGELLLQIAHYVIARSEKKLTTVLVVDEAHHLSVEILEEIRLLSNLETADEKLLQILLVGQPELDDKLDSPALRQLKQRVALRSRLVPLDSEETKGYIQRRLYLAGKSLPSGAVSARDHRRRVSAFPRTAETHQHHLRKRADRGLRPANAKREPRHHRRYRHRLPPWGSNAPGRRAKTSDELDVRKAARSLLELYARLQAEQTREEKTLRFESEQRFP